MKGATWVYKTAFPSTKNHSPLVNKLIAKQTLIIEHLLYSN